MSKQEEVTKGYQKRYCDCKEWIESIESGYGSRKLRELLRHYPNECPFCHKTLKRRLREVKALVYIESELYDDAGAGGIHISLKDLKELLKEVG